MQIDFDLHAQVSVQLGAVVQAYLSWWFNFAELNLTKSNLRVLNTQENAQIACAIQTVLCVSWPKPS
jgi:hypothetical protein